MARLYLPAYVVFLPFLQETCTGLLEMKRYLFLDALLFEGKHP